MKLKNISKTDNVTRMVYLAFLGYNRADIKQVDVLFQFTDGLFNNNRINNLFSTIGHHVDAKG